MELTSPPAACNNKSLDAYASATVRRQQSPVDNTEQSRLGSPDYHEQIHSTAISQRLDSKAKTPQAAARAKCYHTQLILRMVHAQYCNQGCSPVLASLLSSILPGKFATLSLLHATCSNTKTCTWPLLTLLSCTLPCLFLCVLENLPLLLF